MNFYCLGISGVRIDKKTHNLLGHIAGRMIKDRVKNARFGTMGIDGIMSTQFETQSLAGGVGYLFEATLTTPNGAGNVSFLIRGDDPESEDRWGVWINLHEPSESQDEWMN